MRRALPSALQLTRGAGAAATAFVIGLGFGLGPGSAIAFDFAGTKSLVAVTADGARTVIGSIQFTPAEVGLASYKLALKTDVFTDHFLSMREFKCLPATKEISCHVPYPYANPARVGPGQLAWLEHSLLFLYKTPADFGAKLWNGVYFELREQGSSLVGVPMAVDLNEIAAPPKDMSTPPFKKALRHEMPAGSRWLTQLLIE